MTCEAMKFGPNKHKSPPTLRNCCPDDLESNPKRGEFFNKLDHHIGHRFEVVQKHKNRSFWVAKKLG